MRTRPRLAAVTAALVGALLVVGGGPIRATVNPGYQYFAAHSDQTLDVAGESLNNGAAIIQWPINGKNNQRWVPLPYGNDYWILVNVNSKLVLDVAGASTQNGAPLIQWQWNGGLNQLWRIYPVTPDYSVFINAGSFKAMDVTGASTAPGAKVVQWDWNGGPNQLWRADAIG